MESNIANNKFASSNKNFVLFNMLNYYFSIYLRVKNFHLKVMLFGRKNLSYRQENRIDYTYTNMIVITENDPTVSFVFFL